MESCDLMCEMIGGKVTMVDTDRESGLSALEDTHSVETFELEQLSSKLVAENQAIIPIFLKALIYSFIDEIFEKEIQGIKAAMTCKTLF